MSTLFLEEVLYLTEESISATEVNDAINNHKRLIINYHSNGEDAHSGPRVIDVYAYGLTKAGNPVIRAFQPYGDTTTKVPSWKFFRLDRIMAWKDTGQTYDGTPPDNLGMFNPNGDNTMSTVYNIAKFDSETTPETDDENMFARTNPKLKQNAGGKKGELFQTDAEKELKKRGERIRGQFTNPIKLSDLKNGEAFKQFTDTNKPAPTTGPKTKQDTELFKTDTERGLERLKQQLQNPRKIDLDKVGKYQKPEEPTTPEIQPEEPKAPEEPQKPELFKTDTERSLERLRQQLQNAKKIDLEKLREQ